MTYLSLICDVRDNARLSFLVFLPLFVGGSIYLVCRDDSILINQYLPDFSYQVKLPAWVVYSLPDALWSFSLMNFTLLIWQSSRPILLWSTVSIAFAISISSEIGQYLKLIPGVFDPIDLLLKIFLSLTSLIIINHETIKETQH